MELIMSSNETGGVQPERQKEQKSPVDKNRKALDAGIKKYLRKALIINRLMNKKPRITNTSKIQIQKEETQSVYKIPRFR